MGRKWGDILYRGVVSEAHALAPSCGCRPPTEMNLLALLVCITTAVTADVTNSTENATSTEAPTNSTNSTKEILKASETGDPTKTEIVKQIRRLNEDGSYTIGYEANDGTFKIESRDVLGNVKGTFGYLDEDGEIKRVTYSSSGDTTPVPVTTNTTPTSPTMVVRVNKTVSSTTRRPLATVVYPTRSSATTRGTVIQAIPRRRPSSMRSSIEASTEKQKLEETTASSQNLYRKDDILKTRVQLTKPVPVTVKDDLVTKQTTTATPQTLKPVYEDVKEKEADLNKSNGIRRELAGTSSNHHMVSLQQSMGDDSTDVYGSHLSHGTLRPLFTTTTARSRLIPLHTLLAARQKIQQQYEDTQLEDQETTLEASTGRVFDQERENVVTTNPVPVIHIPAHRPVEERVYDPLVYRRPSTIQFRTQEYLRDNPGAPIPIGNQRPFLHYEYQEKVLDPQYVKEHSQPKASEASSVPYEFRPVTRVVQIPVDERGVPLQGYEARFVNPYRSQPLFQRYEPVNDMQSISAPVSTRDFKRLLHILILRQNRLQSLMDQLMPGPPYQPVSYRREPYQPRHYQDDDRYDYRYDPQYRQDVYSNQVQYDDQYESQRYVPRRRYTRPYDSQSSASNHIDEIPEYLPVEVREALLLKMLLLAISPDFVPTPAPATELTTAAPPRKQVRNVQILGEEGSKDTKTNAQKSK